MRKRFFVVLLATTVAAIWIGAGAVVSSAKTVWLCKPGQRPDPCTPGLSTTVYSPTLQQLRVEQPRQNPQPAIDCFYVYPTVSGQASGNSNLVVGPEERSVALYQAARYSQYCRVFAPMYRQVTLAGIGQGTPTSKPDAALALSSAESAFASYLKQDNNGRGFVLIGQSQGASVLRQLIQQKIDRKPSVRKLLVSAILMGGNVLVKRGKNVGGDFQHIPACRSATQLGCVIAFSTFDQPVPTPSLFGRPDSAFGIKVPADTVVLCTNPAALGGGSGPLDPIFPSVPFDPQSVLSMGIKLLGLTQPTPPTVWSTEPGSYRASCSSANDANVLEISAVGGAKTPSPSPTPAWGLHLLDANIALGNLIAIVKRETTAFVARSK